MTLYSSWPQGFTRLFRTHVDHHLKIMVGRQPSIWVIICFCHAETRSDTSLRTTKHDQLINSLLNSADAEAFREPVDWRGLGLQDYPNIIKRPMDLGTVKLRLERGAYPTAEACAADVRLIWENCRTYNTGGVPVNLHKASTRRTFMIPT